jgi:hypothetical protein
MSYQHLVQQISSESFIYTLENFVSTISTICWVETSNNYVSIIRV